MADGKELAETVTSVPLNTDVTLPNGNVITLKEYRNSAIHTSISFSGLLGNSHVLQLRGVNDRGEIIYFYANEYVEGGGTFEISSFNKVRTQNIKSLTLTVYSCDSSLFEQKMAREKDYKPYGEPIYIPLE